MKPKSDRSAAFGPQIRELLWPVWLLGQCPDRLRRSWRAQPRESLPRRSSATAADQDARYGEGAVASCRASSAMRLVNAPSSWKFQCPPLGVAMIEKPALPPVDAGCHGYAYGETPLGRIEKPRREPELFFYRAARTDPLAEALSSPAAARQADFPNSDSSSGEHFAPAMPYSKGTQVSGAQAQMEPRCVSCRCSSISRPGR